MTSQHAQTLADFLSDPTPLLVLTGAGISTASGIPEYRDADGNWKHAKPVQYREFMDSDFIYRRYWARSSVGWRTMGSADPNAAHQALAELEARARLHTLITQNVDGLHERAGSQRLINLHGRLGTVSCQSCGNRHDRDTLQAVIRDNNQQWLAQHEARRAYNLANRKPDGDVELRDDAYAGFNPPWCERCGGRLKPDVVFFGETIPADTVRNTQAAQAATRRLLVIGSSLIVFSGFRIARDFHQRGLPVVIINQGMTRADDLATLKFADDANTLLPAAVARMPKPQDA
ncbi:MAG: NAD-dependent protein deacetylase [Pseudomonadota bacterium]